MQKPSCFPSYFLIAVGMLVLAACDSLVLGPEQAIPSPLQLTATSYSITELELLPAYSLVYPRELNTDGSVIVGSASEAGTYQAVRWNSTGKITSLGTLGGRDSDASAVSADGSTIVGRSQNTSSNANGVRWNAAGAVTDLSSPLNSEYYRDDADMVSADGSVIAGKAYNNLISKVRAVRWSTPGQMTVMGSLGGNKSEPRAISANGTVIVGYSQRSGAAEYDWRAVKWNSTGQITELSSLGGTYSYAGGVSADGSVIIGSAYTVGGLQHAVKWNGAGQIVDLGTLGGRYSGASDVSRDGSVIVGSAQDSASNSYAVRWNATGQITALEKLGGTRSSAVGVSADGSTIFGSAQDSSGKYHPVVWDASGQVTVLGTLNGGYASLTAISADGRVVIGTESAAGSSRGVLWRAQTSTKQDQNITFMSTPPTNAIVGGTYTVGATASSGLTVSFASVTTGVCTVSGSTVSFAAAGTCTVRASQTGNTTYNAAPTVIQSFNVNTATATPASYTVSFTSSNVPVGKVISSVALERGISSTTGTITSNVSIYAKRSDLSGNMAMVVGTAKHLLISKDGASQTPYAKGGYMNFRFSTFGTGSVEAKTIRIKNTTTTGGTVRVYRDSTLLKTVSVPSTGSGVSTTLSLNVPNASRVKVTLTGPGAADNLVFTAPQ